jgi:cytochrome b subunit of formate dehydrogenase
METESGRTLAAVDAEAWGASVHAAAGFGCVACHVELDGVVEFPHAGGLERPDCAACHGEAGEALSAGVHGRAENGPDCVTCHGAHDVRQTADPRSPVSALRVVETCASCHTAGVEGAGPADSAAAFVSQYRESVHGQAIARAGLSVSASCQTCHGAHEVHPAGDPRSPMYRARIPETCGGCHSGVLSGYAGSVHGRALAAGDSSAPVCADCHREHDIRAASDRSSGVFPTRVAELCAGCHDDEAFAVRYGLAARRLLSYRESYHGVASRFGDARVANCASCHGWHEVLPSSDPRSSVAPGNLARTCGGCHRGAGENFAKGKVHIVDERTDNPAAHLVRTAYVILMSVVLGGFVAFILADVWARIRGRGRGRHRSAVQGDDGLVGPEETFVRMTRSERLQHGVLIASFLGLVLTGLPLIFYDVPVLRELGFLGGHFWLRSWLHRLFGIGLIAVSLYHAAYVIGTPRGRGLFLALMPRAKDLTDAFGVLFHDIGFMEALYRRGVLRGFLDRHPGMRFRERPLFDRYNFIEKFEYLAVFWGNGVMILTGLSLWYFTTSLRVLPKYVLDVFVLIHSFEAILAFAAIVIWHMYNVHLNPSVFPMSRVWLTGRITREELRSEHPLEYERIARARKEAASRAARREEGREERGARHEDPR